MRNKIKTIEDVKKLKTPPAIPSYYQYSGKAPEMSRDIIERASERMREIISSGLDRDQIKQEGMEFAEEFS